MRGCFFNVEKYCKDKDIPELVSPFKGFPGGIDDPNIFGVTEYEKSTKAAYINLGNYYLKGAYCSAFKTAYRNIYLCATTPDFYCKLDENNDLVKCEPTDEGAGTGPSFLYTIYDKINKNKLSDIDTGNFANIELKKTLARVTRDQVFTRAQYVLPIGFREEEENGIISVEENKIISSLMSMVQMRLSGGKNVLVDIKGIDTLIQKKLEEIYVTYWVEKMGSSHGDLQKVALSKVVDNSGRSVIVPLVYKSKYIGKEAISINKTGYPIEHVMNYFIEFTLYGSRRFMEFLYDMGAFKEAPKTILRYYDNEKMEKIINMFYKDSYTKLSPVMIPEYDDKEPEPIMLNFTKENGEVINKPLYWIEFFYIVLKSFADIDNKHTFNTRYPTTSEKSSKVQRIHILTLNQYDLTTTATVLGITYEDFFPLITDEIADRYNDKIFEVGCRISPAVTQPMDGDYDGDQISIKPIKYDESLEEAKELENKLINLVSISGKCRRDVAQMGRDPIQFLFSITQEKDIYTKPKYRGKDPLVDEIVGWDMDHIPADFIFENFCDTKDHKAKYSVYDTIDLKVKGQNIITTFGRLLTNKICFGFLWEDKTFPYYNETFSKSLIEESSELLSQMCIEGKTDVETFTKILDYTADFSFRYASVFDAGLSFDCMFPDDDFYEEKDKVYTDKAKEEISKTGDLEKLEKMEKELIDYSKNKFKNDIQNEVMVSGSKASYGNEFREMNITVGAIPSLGDGKVNFVFNSLAEGFDVKDIPSTANLSTFGATERAVQTALGGTMYKRLVKALNSVMGVRGDCGSTHYDTMNTNKPSELYGKYVLDGKELVHITLDNVKKYLGRDIKVRSPLYCQMKGDRFCSTCLGTKPFDILGKDVIPLGAYGSVVGTTIMNKLMKQTHESKVQFFTINDLNDFVGDEVGAL